ncbi:hypothetical protein YpUG050454_2910 [Yersinia pestis biovar Antiqua str. UG05-0454]|nr:hypothetical protein YpUG050454_2910 [Yersinia pestis biovar Antiqua str. UG05-0454]
MIIRHFETSNNKSPVILITIMVFKHHIAFVLGSFLFLINQYL